MIQKVDYNWDNPYNDNNNNNEKATNKPYFRLL